MHYFCPICHEPYLFCADSRTNIRHDAFSGSLEYWSCLGCKSKFKVTHAEPEVEWLDEEGLKNYGQYPFSRGGF